MGGNISAHVRFAKEHEDVPQHEGAFCLEGHTMLSQL